MKTVLIVNPTSGQDRAARERRKLLQLSSRIPQLEIRVTTSPNDAMRFAQEAAASGCERVIVAGGDGTINQVINGLGDSRIPLAIIPMGTGNVLATHLNMPPNDVDYALEVILANNVREIDLGIAGNRRFLLMAGLGIDAAVVCSVSPRVKEVLGTVAYAPAAIEQLVKYSPAQFRLAFDGGSIYETEAFAVIVANCATYAPNVKLAPDASLDDGLLDILVFEGTSRSRLIGQALEALFQRRLSSPDIAYFRATSVRVDSDPPVMMQLDGDVCGESGVDIHVLPKALRLIVPVEIGKETELSYHKRTPATQIP